VPGGNEIGHAGRIFARAAGIYVTPLVSAGLYGLKRLFSRNQSISSAAAGTSRSGSVGMARFNRYSRRFGRRFRKFKRSVKNVKKFKRRFRKFMRRKSRRYLTPKMLRPGVMYAKMTYRINCNITGGSNIPSSNVYPYADANDHTKICANSVYAPNHNYVFPRVPNTPVLPCDTHAGAFEYFSQQFNSFEVVASRCKVTWQQTVNITNGQAPYIVGIKVADGAQELAIANPVPYYNIPMMERNVYGSFAPDTTVRTRKSLSIGFNARKRWLGARPVQNTVTRLSGTTNWNRPNDQIWFIPYICTQNNTTVMDSHLVRIRVTYYVKWSDPRTIHEWNRLNTNAEFGQAQPQAFIMEDEEDQDIPAEDEEPEAAPLDLKSASLLTEAEFDNEVAEVEDLK